MAQQQYTQHFEVGPDHLGLSLRGPVVRNARIEAPLSYAFACGTCGAVWARCPVRRSGDPATTRWQFLIRCCAPCGGEASLWVLWDHDFTAALPERALRREMEIVFKYYPIIGDDNDDRD